MTAHDKNLLDPHAVQAVRITSDLPTNNLAVLDDGSVLVVKDGVPVEHLDPRRTDERKALHLVCRGSDEYRGKLYEVISAAAQRLFDGVEMDSNVEFIIVHIGHEAQAMSRNELTKSAYRMSRAY